MLRSAARLLAGRLEHAMQLPSPVAQLLDRVRQVRYERLFWRADWHCFRGVYATPELALRAIPPDRRNSYDNADSADLYRDRLDRVYAHDYAMLYWLRPLIERGQVRRVFDVGGHVGIAYYGYRRYLPGLAEVEWTVCDVPAVAQAGRRLAAERGERQLTFTSEYSPDGCDLVYASGSLQYVMQPRLGAILAACKNLPSHVLVNMLPTTERDTFFTLNNISTAICPYLIANRREFLDSLTSLGYQLVDAWRDPEKKCIIPFHPEHSVQAYEGFYLARR